MKSSIERKEERLDSVKLKAQTALAQYENEFDAAYRNALLSLPLKSLPTRTIIIMSARPGIGEPNDTIKIYK